MMFPLMDQRIGCIEIMGDETFTDVAGELGVQFAR